KSRYIEREGPTGLIVTTTLASMHPENETRYLSVTVADTPAQTHHILRTMATAENAARFDPIPWRSFQESLESGTREVSIPFAGTLVDIIPPVAVRLRRDVAKLLTLIRTHALLHEATRRKDEHDRIIAEIKDYQAVYELMADLIAHGVEATVPKTVRETVEAVRSLIDSKGAYREGASAAVVAGGLRLDRSAAWRRIQVAIQKRYSENLET